MIDGRCTSHPPREHSIITKQPGNLHLALNFKWIGASARRKEQAQGALGGVVMVHCICAKCTVHTNMLHIHIRIWHFAMPPPPISVSLSLFLSLSLSWSLGLFSQCALCFMIIICPVSYLQHPEAAP
jgi:hypothetical protein